MKRIKLILIAIIIAASAHSQELTETFTGLDSLGLELSNLQQKYSDLATSNNALKKRVATLEGMINNLQGESETVASRVSEAEAGLARTESSIKDTRSGLEAQIKDTNNAVSNQNVLVKNRTTIGLIVALCVLIISALITILFNRKGTAKIEALQSKADKLNEEIVNRLSSEISEIQKISATIGALSTAGATSQNEQELIMALADRITFMEMTLYKMDPSVRGYSHLKRSISQMKDNLKANGYELIDMLGNPYNEGMKAIVSFEDDENLPEGNRIITKIIKPQINYNGVMIQSAQITVSQNI